MDTATDSAVKFTDDAEEDTFTEEKYQIIQDTIDDETKYTKDNHPVETPNLKEPGKCPSLCTNANTLEIDEKPHDDENSKFVCDQCAKVFKNASSLRTHALVHTVDKPYKCDFCDVRFKLRGSLKEHYKLHKGLVFKCSFCGKDFNKIGNLKTHEKRHTGQLKQYVCNICNRKFTQKCLLGYHMRSHSGDKPFKCSVCETAFACKSNLRKHFRIHTGEKPFKCDLCSKAFNQKSSLTCHKRTHVTFKPFVCKYCDKSFGLHEELLVHLRTHGEIKSFKCSICDEEFREHCHLKSHVRMHTLDKTNLRTEVLFKQELDVVLKEDGRKKAEDFVAKVEEFDTKIGRISSGEQYGQDNGRPNGVKNADHEPFENVFLSDIDYANLEAMIPTVTLKTEPDDDSDHCNDATSEFDDTSSPMDVLDVEVKTELKTDIGLEDDEYEKPLNQRIHERYSTKSNRIVNKNQRPQTGNDTAAGSLKLKLKIAAQEGVRIYKIESNEKTKRKRSRRKRLKPKYKECSDNENQAKNVASIDDRSKNACDKVDVNSIQPPPKKRKRLILENTEENSKENATQETSDELPEKQFPCPDCPKVYLHAHSLRYHQLKHLKSFDCPTCNLAIKTSVRLQDHFKTSKKCQPKMLKKSFKCYICDKNFINNEKLEFHILGHTGLKPFKCAVCPKAFRSKQQHKTHMNVHNKINLHPCEICGKTFATKGHLNQHNLRHNDDKPFKCDICAGSFKSHGRLYNHMKVHQEDSYKCSFCGKGFKIIGNLQIHEKRHSGGDGTEHPCEVCGKTFLFKHKLKYHMRTHTGERPFACNFCNARFADTSNLQKHMRIHTGVKPYKCLVCGKDFNQLSSLNSHKKSHLTFKPFRCNYCGKDFALDVDLTIHLRVHGDYRLFKCNVCDKEYEQLCNLKSHRRLHYGNELKDEERNIKASKWGKLVYNSPNNCNESNNASKHDLLVGTFKSEAELQIE